MDIISISCHPLVNHIVSLHISLPLLVIAKRRIGRSAIDIRDFILQTDLDGLSGEYCELLLKFIPTEEEVGYLCSTCTHECAWEQYLALYSYTQSVYI